jgi:DNA polymerase-3 subunit delta
VSEAVYLLLGDEFLVDEALDQIRAETGAEALSEVEMPSGVSPAEIVEALRTGSLLGGRRLVVVPRAQELKKEHVAALETYLESPSPESVLVLVASGRTALTEVVKRRGAVVALTPPRGRGLLRWLRERARARELRLDERGGWALIEAVGNELRDLDAALEQLATALGAGAVVTAAEVQHAFSRLTDERIYALTDAVGDRKLGDAMSALRRLLVQGEEPLVIMGALAAHVRRMIVARHNAEGGAHGVGAALGLPEWRAGRLLRQARAYREEEMMASLQVLARTDLDIKAGELLPELALERAVIAMVGGRSWVHQG